MRDLGGREGEGLINALHNDLFPGSYIPLLPCPPAPLESEPAPSRRLGSVVLQGTRIPILGKGGSQDAQGREGGAREENTRSVAPAASRRLAAVPGLPHTDWLPCAGGGACP